jgi:hypothetical protein
MDKFIPLPMHRRHVWHGKTIYDTYCIYSASYLQNLQGKKSKLNADFHKQVELVL